MSLGMSNQTLPSSCSSQKVTIEVAMFSNQRRNSGAGGLVGVAALLAGWIAVAAVMWSSYAAPQLKDNQCQVVCRQTIAQQHSKG